jgi:ribokinase
MFDIITIGGASRDVFFMTSKGRVINDLRHHSKLIAFDYGSKIIPEEARFTYGGGALNTAVACAKMELRVSTVMNIGAEGTGSLVIKDLANVGVNTDHVVRDHAHHTAMSIIVGLPGEDHTMFLYRGSNNNLTIRDWRPLRAKWFFLSSLTGESVDVIPELFSYARAHNIKVAWNPGSEQLAGGYDDLSSYLEETAILIVNREEARQLVASKDKSLSGADEKKILSVLHQMTGGTVVMTDGPNGSYLADGKKEYHEAARADKVVETTGAGDAYGATFVSAIIKGYGNKYAMKLASLNSGSVVGRIGAQEGLLTFAELSSKIESKEITNS